MEDASKIGFLLFMYALFVKSRTEYGNKLLSASKRSWLLFFCPFWNGIVHLLVNRNAFSTVTSFYYVVFFTEKTEDVVGCYEWLSR